MLVLNRLQEAIAWGSSDNNSRKQSATKDRDRAMQFLHILAAALFVSIDHCSHSMRERNGGVAKGLSLLVAVVALLKASVVGAVTIGSGFSAMWFDPARNGEGLQLEILDTDRALVEWYTYNEQGGQRWFQGVGQIVHGGSGDSIEFPQLYVTHGGHFGPSFNPDEVEAQIVGDMTLWFSDCNTGTFRYSAFGQSQTLPITRLTQTMGAGCTPINGVPGQPVFAYAGQSGSWYDISHRGEGFALQWMSRNEAIVTWYTYDTLGNQVWLLGVGTEQDGSIVFEQMSRAHGPHFGASYDPAAFQADDWGTLTLQLDCNSGTAHYASSKAEFGSGNLTLTRLTNMKRPDCPTAKPKFSDLYDITWHELPIESGTVQDPNNLSADGIADDGTVAGRRGGHLVLWHPDRQVWEDVPRELAPQPVFISPDGSLVIATDNLNIGEPQPVVHSIMWQQPTGWQVLPGLGLSINYSVSQNFNYIAGTGRDAWEGPDYTWVQAIDGVQKLMPKATAPEFPYAVSNDGKTIIGVELRFPTPSFPEPVAVRWDNGGTPTIIHNPEGEELSVAGTCDADCNIIFGEGLYNYDPNHPHPGEAWYLKSDGVFGYLGALPDAPVTSISYTVTDATPDGSIAVGSYYAYQFVGYPNSGTGSRAFIWTEATGIVSVRALVDELGIGDDDWNETYSVRISSDGRRILWGGIHAMDPIGYNVEHSRAVVLQLVPKPASE